LGKITVEKIRREDFGAIIQVNKELRIEHYRTFKGRLSSPISVSMSITSDCPLNCNCCYSKKRPQYMPVEKIRSIFSGLHKMGVFEVHIGGGEPLLREDLFEILSACKGRFITSLTTSGYNLGIEEAKRLRGLVDQININFHSPFAIRALQNLLSAGGEGEDNSEVGVNLILERKGLSFLREHLYCIKGLNIKNLYLLRPKPVPKNLWWYRKNRLDAPELTFLKGVIREFIEELHIFIDCSLLQLLGDMPSWMKALWGLFGCQAGIRRVFISSDGKVYPCSFLTQESDCMGDLYLEDFGDIWRRNPASQDFNRTMCPPRCLSRFEEVRDYSSELTGKISIRYGRSSEHSAADYLFYSIEKIPPKVKKEIKRVLEAQLIKDDFVKAGEMVSVDDHGIDHNSWIFLDHEFKERLLDRYFDVEFSDYEFSSITEARISFPWDEELYSILKGYEGRGEDASLSVRKGEKRIILEFYFYTTHSHLSRNEIVEGILLPIREGLMERRDFSPLQAYVDFYEIPCTNQGKKEEYSKLARRFRRNFSKGDFGRIPVYLFDKVWVQVSNYLEKGGGTAVLVFPKDEELRKNLMRFDDRSVFLTSMLDYLVLHISFRLKSELEEDFLEELFGKIREEILEDDFSSLDYIFRFYNKLSLEGIKVTKTVEILQRILH